MAAHKWGKPLLVILILIGMLPGAALPALAQGPDDDDGPIGGLGAPDPDRPVGLVTTSDAVADGYVLVPMVQSKAVLLIANDGRIVNIWSGDYYVSNSVYLLENGNLLRTASLDEPANAFGFNGQWGFTNGRLEEYNWDGDLVWSIDFATADMIGHHDIEVLPDGNILLITFERFTAEEAVAAGRDPNLIPEDGEVWGEKIIELDRETGEIVWQWRLWDHLVQDYAPDAPNYGVVADHPERVDMNFLEVDQRMGTNWWHVNAVDYNPALDQIMLSPRTYSELWIIDHATTTEEAAGPAGDLLYRWGNPAVHDAGTPEDRVMFYQHDTQWIPEGYPGAGHVLLYDNGGDERPYSTVIEIALPLNEDGTYTMTPGEPTGPADFAWQYLADPPEDFYSALISGAQRQPNGNTLIAEGLNGRLFEVNPAGEIVWEYHLPPAAWAFRAERYDLPAFADLDLSGDYTFTGGEVWGQDCADGHKPRLHQYLIHESADMDLFIETHGDRAQEQWETESCAEHGGFAAE
jgi:hypothetical protein